MQVNSTINNIYRYYEKNPEEMNRYYKKVEQMATGLTDKFASAEVVLDSKMDSIMDSPVFDNLIRKIVALFSRPSIEAVFLKSDIAMQNTTVVKGDFKSSLKFLAELKKDFRKAFRQDREANEMAKDLITELKNPVNKDFFEPLNNLLKSFSPQKSESMADFYLDTALLAPKEIREDYYNSIKRNNEILNRPAHELYADVFNSLIKK